MLPGIMTHLGSDGLAQLKRLATATMASKQGLTSEDNDIPELIETFENAMNSGDQKQSEDVSEMAREVVD
jgi:hypothetical protein